MTTETIEKEETVKTVKTDKQKSDPSSRKPEFYNFWRRLFLYLVTHLGYMAVFKIMYRLEVYGRENIPKDSEYIVASNHLSTLDPPLVCAIINKGVNISESDTFSSYASKISQIEVGESAALNVNTVNKLDSGWQFGLITTSSNTKISPSISDYNNVSSFENVTIPFCPLTTPTLSIPSPSIISIISSCKILALIGLSKIEILF